MRSSDDTYYNINRLHVVFAVASALLLGVTVWMFVVDHDRPWKVYQRTYRDRVEPWLAESQAAGQADEAPQPVSLDGSGRRLAVDQIWLPELTIDYNFRRVARFDRCTTCHLAIDKVEPGTEAKAEVASRQELTLELLTPGAPPVDGQRAVESLYGLSLAPRGILVDDRATVLTVADESPAARAGLYAGDAIREIDGRPVADREQAIRKLIEPQWGEPLQLEIERGLPEPYCGHPRLDLFVGAKSPHPLRDFGCTICHAGQGSATDFTFASHSPNTGDERRRWRDEHDWYRNEHWDFPMLAGRFAESSCLQCHHEVTDLEPTERFRDAPAPKLLAGYHLIRENGCFGCHEIRGVDMSGRSIGPDMRLQRDEAKRGSSAREPGGIPPGTMRKVGPNLRNVAGRFDNAVLEGWIADPQTLRPTTRMPRFFGLDDHLEGDELAKVQRFEAVEIGAIRAYLLGVSEPLELLPTPPEVTETPTADRGKALFVRAGCAACHRHEDVPEATSTVGADLTGLGSLITADTGEAWLTSWLRDPAYHFPDTRMPNSQLAPEVLGGDTEDGRPRMSDPAADLAAYLLESKGESPVAFPPVVEADLDALARLHLLKQFSAEQVDEFLTRGAPRETDPRELGDAVELLAPVSKEKKLRYVGRRTIAKRGCFGCHGIPGFEQSQIIGPALTDWGRKQESLLAFEKVDDLLKLHPPTDADGSPADREFYLEAIAEKRREGFIWQKLGHPRSFDFQKTAQKGYNAQLTMGKFSFTPTQREQIMTFVLGLVADPPSEAYVFSPDRRTKAIAEGRKVLDRYGCAECHTLRMPRWRFRYDPEWWEGAYEDETFDFVRPHFSRQAVAESLVRDRTGWGVAEVVGRPLVDESGEVVLDEDDDGNPLYVFSLWEPALINGEVWRVGGAQVPVAEPYITHRYPAWGGAFASLLYPTAAEESGAAWLEAWGRVPPALVNEGALVQPSWLYDYLLAPAPIRPSVLLQMPRFNLSESEAAALVDYFAAASGAEFPYAAGAQTETGTATDRRRAAEMDQAMRLVTDRTTYCAKCHVIGDYDPGGETQTILAPDLARVGRRIRTEYLRRWLADPKSIVPYTGMPVNFPPTGDPVGQDLLPGDSRKQLDAVVDLLLHYDAYLQKRTSIRAMIEGTRPAESE